RAADAANAGRRNVGLTAAGVALVMLAVSVGVALDPVAVATPDVAATAGGVTATGVTTRVEVTAKDMRLHPSTIEVTAGNRLVINLKNTDDSDVHDLVLETGQDSGRLNPGESATVDVGVLGRDIDGWCSVAGHRQMGMVLDIQVTGPASKTAATGATDSDEGSAAGNNDGDRSAADDLDFMADPSPDFAARDARLKPAPNATVHKRTFTVSEVERAVAAGVTQRLWTFNRTAPGPTLRGKVGDVFEITLVNDGSMGHAID